MHIAPIQTMNSYNKPNFRASFARDENGKMPEVLKRLWYNADKTPELFEKIDKFSREHEGVEIDIKEGSDGNIYIFNPDSGRFGGVDTQRVYPGIQLLKLIDFDGYDNFFKTDDEEAIACKSLVGQANTNTNIKQTNTQPQKEEEERLEFRDIWDDNY